MVAATTLALVGLGVSVAGAAGQAIYTSQAASASRRAERLREQQMRLDAANKRRAAVRQMIQAQSLATARQTAQGVGEGSSVIGGAFGQISGEGGRQTSYINESEDIGGGIFQANRDQSSAQGMASLFGGLGNLGGAVLSNAQEITRIGTTLFGSTAAAAVPMIPPTSNPWSPAIATPSAAVNVPISPVRTNPFYNFNGPGAVPY